MLIFFTSNSLVFGGRFILLQEQILGLNKGDEYTTQDNDVLPCWLILSQLNVQIHI